MANDLTEAEVDQLKSVFEVFDKDHDGHITSQELGDVMRSLGQNPTDSELQDLVDELDTDEDGTIEFPEFVAMMAHKLATAESGGELLTAFKVFDQDNDGIISRAELKKVMEAIGENLTEPELDEMMHDIDTNGDGMISYAEFVEFMSAK